MQEISQKINAFWFEKCPDMDKWFMKSTEYDEYIKEQFADNLKDAENGKYFNWLLTKDSYIAHIILMDQFSRQIYRGTGDAFKNDNSILMFTLLGIDVYYPLCTKYEKMFILLPFMHSENKQYQTQGLQRVQQELENNPNDPFWENVHSHTFGHFKVIARFGRFPKRNAVLNRTSTPEELKYIEEHADRPY